MIKQKVQNKSSTISLEKTKDIELSIQFSLDGFSFCVLDTISNKDIYFSTYSFEETLNSPEDLLKTIESIFKNDSNLQIEYDAVSVIHQNNLSTLVPTKYFNEDDLATYLNYNIKTLKTDFIALDNVNIIDAKKRICTLC